MLYNPVFKITGLTHIAYLEYRDKLIYAVEFMHYFYNTVLHATGLSLIKEDCECTALTYGSNIEHPGATDV